MCKFVQGQRFRVLQLLRDYGEQSGADLHTRDPKALPRGTIYTTLQRLEDDGLVVSKRHRGVREAGPPRRRFTVTEQGRRMVLAAEVAGAIVA